MLEKHLQENGCCFDHHGGRHDIWVREETGAEAPVPRHAEIKAICKQLGIAPPPGS